MWNWCSPTQHIASIQIWKQTIQISSFRIRCRRCFTWLRSTRQFDTAYLDSCRYTYLKSTQYVVISAKRSVEYYKRDKRGILLSLVNNGRAHLEWSRRNYWITKINNRYIFSLWTRMLLKPIHNLAQLNLKLEIHLALFLQTQDLSSRRKTMLFKPLRLMRQHIRKKF